VKNFIRSAGFALSFSFAAFAIATATPHLARAANSGGAPSDSNVDPDADYDRLDGSGKSGKTVQVIEWEDNLEVHVYPPGSLKGLALKIDRPSKGKKVMVLGYRFADAPKQQLIRRAILGISLTDGFKVYKDPTETEFDKIIISNNGLSGQVVGFALDPTPTQLYPDGYPAGGNVANANPPGQDGQSQGQQAPSRFGGRSPASVKSAPAESYAGHYEGDGNYGNGGSNGNTGAGNYGSNGNAGSGNSGSANYQGSQGRAQQVDDAGTIQPFFSNRRGQ
jgi:hypothetical protein